MIKTLN